MPDSRVTRFDVTTLGETMLRLSVPLGRRLDDAHSLEMEAAGAESNVCTALARLGRRCGWVSRLPANALGNLVVRQLRSDGIDVSAVRRVPNERIGTYYIEFGAKPRGIQVIYDRANSAASRMTREDIDWNYVLDTRVLHLTGITPALSASCCQVVTHAMEQAGAAGVTISFDVNYRATLWDAATAGATLRPLVAQADILFCKSADASLLFGINGAPRELLTGLQSLTRARAIYCTFGEQGAALLTGDEFTQHAALPVQIVDRIGSGDAFAAGVLDGWLDGDAREGLKRGIALAAIALSQYGDRALTSRAELDAVMAQDAREITR